MAARSIAEIRQEEVDKRQAEADRLAKKFGELEERWSTATTEEEKNQLKDMLDRTFEMWRAAQRNLDRAEERGKFVFFPIFLLLLFATRVGASSPPFHPLYPVRQPFHHTWLSACLS